MTLAKTLIIEDDAFLRSMTESSLEAAGISVLTATASAAEAVAAVSNLEVEVALLDLYLGPGPNGIDIANALRAIKPNLGLVFLTSFSDHRLLDSQLKLPLGAIFLTKSKVASLRDVLTAILRAKHSPLRTADKRTDSTRLTDHQIQVWRLVAEGLKNSEIANLLGVTEKAVEHVVKRVLFELGIEQSSKLNPRVQLVREFGSHAGQQLDGRRN